jgi:cytochrome P450
MAKLAPRIEAARRREPHGMLGLLAHHKEPDGSSLTTAAIAAHVLLLFWAGYDTTAGTGGWVLHMLAEHPEWQTRLRDEARRVLGDRDLAITDQDALVEHGWFLKEIERRCPVVLFFPRRAVNDVDVGGMRLPAGTQLMYSPYLSHLGETPDDADVFDPLRFSPERTAQAPTKTPHLIGFGGGPRICIGKAFALLQLRVMLTTLLRHHRIERVARGTVLGLPTHRPAGSTIRFVPL